MGSILYDFCQNSAKLLAADSVAASFAAKVPTLSLSDLETLWAFSPIRSNFRRLA